MAFLLLKSVLIFIFHLIAQSIGQESTPEQAKLVHNFLYSGDRRYIESPLKPAPPPIIIRKSSLTQNTSSSYSSQNKSSSLAQDSSSSSYKSSNKVIYFINL